MTPEHPNPRPRPRTQAATLARRLLAAVTGELGRRLARAAGLTIVLAVVVTALYDRGEVPTAAAQQAI